MALSLSLSSPIPRGGPALWLMCTGRMTWVVMADANPLSLSVCPGIRSQNKTSSASDNEPGIGAMAVVLLAGLQVGQVLLALLRLPPDPPVEDAHDRHGSVEGRNGRPERDVIVRLDELDEALVYKKEKERERETFIILGRGLLWSSPTFHLPLCWTGLYIDGQQS